MFCAKMAGALAVAGLTLGLASYPMAAWSFFATLLVSAACERVQRRPAAHSAAAYKILWEE